MTGLEKMLQKKLPVETFVAVKEALTSEDFDWVPRSRLDDVIEERDNARMEVSTLKKDLEKAKTQDYAELEQKYNTDIAAKDAEIDKIKRDFTIEGALQKAKAKNIKITRAALDESKIKKDFSNLDDLIAEIKKSDAYLFEDDVPGGTGTDGAGSGDAGKGKADVKDDGVTSEMFNAVMGGIF